MKYTLFFFFFMLISQFGWSQELNRYMVFLNTKEGSPYTPDKPNEFLTSRAIERRVAQNIAVTEQDLPVNEAFVDQIEALGVPVYFRSRWMNAVLVEGTFEEVNALTSLTFVDRVEFVAPGKKLGARLKSDKQQSMEVPQVQHDLLGVPLMHELGFTGKGKMIAVLDDGFMGVNEINKFDHLYRNNQLRHTKDFVGNSGDVYRYDDHGTLSLSTIAVVDSGTFIGTAPDALFLLAVTEDLATEYIIEEYNWLIASEWADSLGTDIITSSLGYYTFDDPSMDHLKSDLDGKTTVAARAAVWASERGILVVSSAGNSRENSWGTISTPADADNILAVGAIDAQGDIAYFSSPGPSADGRVKPDVVAMGVATVVVDASGSYTQRSGTSFSAPQIAGFAAGVWQAFPELTNLEVRQLIINSADRLTMPDADFGYGLPSFLKLNEPFDQNNREQLVIIYPNPLLADKQILYLETKSSSLKAVQVQVMDLSGRVITNKIVDPVAAGHYQLDISTLPAGMYILQIVQEKELSKHKFLRL